MTYCERCDLDDTMCPHGPAARQRETDSQARARREKRLEGKAYAASGLIKTSNRDWESGERLGAADYLRLPQHASQAEVDVGNAWANSSCQCGECAAAGRGYIDPKHPAIPGLARFSRVALQESVWAFRDPESDHEKPTSPNDWLAFLTDRYNRVRRERADQNDLDNALHDRGKSGRVPGRWMGRSPGYYSRGRGRDR